MLQFNVIEPYDKLNDEGAFDITDSKTFHNSRGVVAYLLAKNMVSFADIAADYVNVLEHERWQHHIENSESSFMATYAAGEGANLQIPQEYVKDHAKRWLYRFGNMPDERRAELEKELTEKNVNLQGNYGFADLYFAKPGKE